MLIDFFFLFLYSNVMFGVEMCTCNAPTKISNSTGRSISQSVHILILRCWDQFWNGKLIKGTWAHQPGFKDMYI